MDTDAILGEVGSWDGVASDGSELRYAGRLLGRLRDGSFEIAYPPRIREMLVETGRAEAHDEPGLVRFAGDDDEAFALFRLAYERARVRERVRRTGSRSASDPP